MRPWLAAFAVASLAMQAAAFPVADTQELEVSPTLRIDGDDGFASTPLVDIRGQGTAEDPYIIENVTFLATEGVGLHLVGTRAHVVVRNVSVLGPEATASLPANCLTGEHCRGRGIHLQDAQNVRVEDVEVVAADHAVVIEDSAHVRVQGATLGDDDAKPPNVGVAVQVANSHAVTISDATARNVEYGAVFERSEDVTLRNSTISGAVVLVGGVNGARTAVRATHSQGVTISDITTSNVGYAAVLEFSGDVTLRNSTLTGGAGVLVAGIDGATFSNNVVQQAGFLLREENRNIRFDHNTFIGGGDAVVGSAWSSSFHNLTVCGNRFMELDGAAVDVRFGAHANITGNVVDGNTHGFILSSVDDVRAVGNAFTRSSGVGFAVTGRGATLHHNVFEDNRWGVEVQVDDADARWNWWGALDGPSGDEAGSGDPLITYGHEVATDPWLTEPPATPRTCDVTSP